MCSPLIRPKQLNKMARPRGEVFSTSLTHLTMKLLGKVKFGEAERKEKRGAMMVARIWGRRKVVAVLVKGELSPRVGIVV